MVNTCFSCYLEGFLGSKSIILEGITYTIIRGVKGRKNKIRLVASGSARCRSAKTNEIRPFFSVAHNLFIGLMWINVLWEQRGRDFQNRKTKAKSSRATRNECICVSNGWREASRH